MERRFTRTESGDFLHLLLRRIVVFGYTFSIASRTSGAETRTALQFRIGHHWFGNTAAECCKKRLVQIAGNQCKVCHRGIILSKEGKFCAQCGTFVHLTCLPQAECDVCGRQFQHEEDRKPDPLREALLPPALRPVSSGAPMLAIGLALILLAAGIILWLVLQHMEAK
jgi:hypothetical protein